MAAEVPRLCACACGRPVAPTPGLGRYQADTARYASPECATRAQQGRQGQPRTFVPWEPKAPREEWDRPLPADRAPTSGAGPLPAPSDAQRPLSSYPNTDEGRWLRFWDSVERLKGWRARHPNVVLPRKEEDPL